MVFSSDAAILVMPNAADTQALSGCCAIARMIYVNFIQATLT